MFNMLFCCIKIAFTWLNPASVMGGVWSASKNGLIAALSLGYLVAVLILLQYLVWFLLLNSTLASMSTCISISLCCRSYS